MNTIVKELFLKILDMSYTGGWLMAAVILTRLLLRKAPRWMICLLWGLVALRLICPFSMESSFSLIPEKEPLSGVMVQEPLVMTEEWQQNVAVPTYTYTGMEDTGVEREVKPADSVISVMDVLAYVWAAGVVLMMAYGVVSYYRIKKYTDISLNVRDNIYQCDTIDTPFILGMIHPRIFVPSVIEDCRMEYVVAHEKAHIRRGDHLWKPLGFVILCVYWFHPLCWISYILLCRDIELACDECVVSTMALEDKKLYAEALLSCSINKKIITICPLAFGEVGVKERIKSILHYKKPAFWVLVISALVCVIVAVCFLTSPDGKKEDLTVGKVEDPLENRDDTSAESAVGKESDDGTEDAADTTIAPDLNRNGIAEEVRLIDMDDGQGQRLEIWENGELIDFEEGYFAHAGRTSIFLCTLEGEDYLLRYHPTMYQGVCTYDYALSTLTNNEETVVQSNWVNFDINFGSPVHDGFNPDEIAAFMDEINNLLAHSVQLLNTDSDLLDTFEKEGRLYDSLWWLDVWEPVFSRDKEISLLENLKDFQTAMMEVQESVTPEAMDGLPITQPLEMAFYSGAGAWGTSLVLNPDGSFVGDYSDADGLTVYVCQFHGQFGNVEKLTDNSWSLTLEGLELDTGRSVGEEWDEIGGDYTFHYISSEPYGFNGADETALKTGAQFILYSPGATGHEPGTELYGAAEFQSWMHERKGFINEDDILGCWGLQNVETGQGFFSDDR